MARSAEGRSWLFHGRGGGLIGLVLAAGAGKRLQPDTDSLPKTLLTVDGDRTILDVALANLKHVGIDEVAVVVGFAADRVVERVPELERRHGLRVEPIFNPRAEEWNNAYSLWCAREAYAEGALLVNGDTVHPASVEEVHLSGDGLLERINKAIEPSTAHGEYIGLTLIEPEGAAPLTDALEATWRRDPSLYYEDGFQELADRGARIGIAPIGEVDWVEVDDHDDLARARELACRC